MSKDEELPKQIEGVFERTGLGNADAEKIPEFLEQYQKAMSLADRLKHRKGRNFEEILESVPEVDFTEES